MCDLVCFASKNTRVSRPYNSEWMSGWDEYSYNKLFDIGWNLFDTVPQTKLFQSTLMALGGKLVKSTHSLDIIKSFERWKDTEENTETSNFHSIKTL